MNELSKVENADPDAIMSVQFDPDGKTIVSGGASGTLKVWDAGCPAPPNPAPIPKLSAPTLATASLELKAEKQSTHSRWVSSVAFSPDGKSIVSGSGDQTIKVWDAGGLAPPILPLSQS